MKTIPMSVDRVQDHFTARAAHYNRSSHWCTDQVIMDRVLALTEPGPDDHVLDVAVGTGLVSRHFHGKVARLVGLDINEAMFEQCKPYVDELVVSPGEDMPFADNCFDLVVCRQGIQFMESEKAMAEMVRVLKPGGRVCSIDLCAYGEQDRDEYFEILRLRNPVRRNFFAWGDVQRLMEEAGCARAESHRHISEEDVDVWSDNKAIPEQRREGIRRVYREATPAFAELHSVALGEGRIVDCMLFALTIGWK